MRYLIIFILVILILFPSCETLQQESTKKDIILITVGTIVGSGVTIYIIGSYYYLRN